MGNSKLIKKIFIGLYIFCCIFFVSSNKLLSKEEIFINEFIKNLYNIKNDSIVSLEMYNNSYPKDKFSLKLKPYMTTESYYNFTSEKIQHQYINDAYKYGFSSTCKNIKIMPVKNSDVYNFETTVSIIYLNSSIKEDYIIEGSISLIKLNDTLKIIHCDKIIMPSVGTSSVLSQLV